MISLWANLMTFSKFMKLCNHHHNLVFTSFHLPYREMLSTLDKLNSRGAWEQGPTSCISNPHAGSTSSPLQSGAPRAETGSQEAWLRGGLRSGSATSLFFCLPGSPSERQSFRCPDLSGHLHLCPWHSFLFLLLFLVLHCLRPQPPRLRPAATARSPGMSEHLAIWVPAAGFPLVRPCGRLFRWQPEGSWSKPDQSRPLPCSKPSRGAHWPCSSQNRPHLLPPQGLCTCCPSFLVSLFGHFVRSLLKCHFLGEAFPVCFILAPGTGFLEDSFSTGWGGEGRGVHMCSSQ